MLFCWDPATVGTSWIVRDYFPALARLARKDFTIEETLRRLGGGRVEPVPIPHDCRDGFFHAFWRRPHAYLDPVVRANISIFAKVDADEGIERLRADLESGEWERRHGHLLGLDELDCGYRLIVA